ncbi:MAG: hypothetical protein HY294_10400 [Candidatus Rokubacteria bacterium]|nr:hypothetical protein [Candidatus Rokubacteria bacterium]MBI3826394.1 hypothetical protein [Candidatus Rokubacteria bacterium]
MGKLTIEERRRMNAARRTRPRAIAILAEPRDREAWRRRFGPVVGLIALGMSVIAAAQAGLPGLAWRLASTSLSASSLLEWLMPVLR